MRWHPEENNAVLLTEGSEFQANMALMVVKNQQPLAANGLRSGVFLKVLDPQTRPKSPLDPHIAFSSIHMSF